jgi:hypothetical protein
MIIYKKSIPGKEWTMGLDVDRDARCTREVGKEGVLILI